MIVNYKPWAGEDINFRAFYKRIFRMPTLNDLYYTFIGNKLLNPECQHEKAACVSDGPPPSRRQPTEHTIEKHHRPGNRTETDENADPVITPDIGTDEVGEQ